MALLIKTKYKDKPSYGYHTLAIRDDNGWVFSDNLCHKVF